MVNSNPWWFEYKLNNSSITFIKEILRKQNEFHNNINSSNLELSIKIK